MSDKKHFNVGRSPPTKTPEDTVAAIREDWLKGDRNGVIATRYDVSCGVVSQACADLTRTEKPSPLVSGEIDRLLRGWGSA